MTGSLGMYPYGLFVSCKRDRFVMLLQTGHISRNGIFDVGYCVFSSVSLGYAPGQFRDFGHKDAVLILRYEYSQLHTFYHVCIAHKGVHFRVARFIIQWHPLWARCCGRADPVRIATVTWFARVQSTKRVSRASSVSFGGTILVFGVTRSAARRGWAVQCRAAAQCRLDRPDGPVPNILGVVVGEHSILVQISI